VLNSIFPFPPPITSPRERKEDAEIRKKSIKRRKRERKRGEKKKKEGKVGKDGK